MVLAGTWFSCVRRGFVLFKPEVLTTEEPCGGTQRRDRKYSPQKSPLKAHSTETGSTHHRGALWRHTAQRQEVLTTEEPSGGTQCRDRKYSPQRSPLEAHRAETGSTHHRRALWRHTAQGEDVAYCIVIEHHDVIKDYVVHHCVLQYKDKRFN